MTQPARFLFDTDFDATLISPEKEKASLEADKLALNDEIASLKETLEREKKRSYDEGFAAGQKDAHASLEAKTLAAMEKVLTAFNNAQQSVQDEAEHARDDAIKIAISAAQKLCGEFTKRDPLADLIPFLENTIEHLGPVPHLTIEVNETVAQQVEVKLGSVAKDRGFAGYINVKGRTDLAAQDAQVVWQDGRIVYAPSEISDLIDAQVRAFFSEDETDDASGQPSAFDASVELETGFTSSPGETNE